MKNSPFRKGAGFLLMGAALFLAAFMVVLTVHRIFWIVGHPEEVAQGPPGVLVFAVIRLVLAGLAAAVVYFLGRRLADPGRFERLVKEAAADIVGESAGLDLGEATTDEVSSAYDGLPLSDLVLIHSSIDRVRHRGRYLALLAAVVRKSHQG